MTTVCRGLGFGLELKLLAADVGDVDNDEDDGDGGDEGADDNDDDDDSNLDLGVDVVLRVPPFRFAL